MNNKENIMDINSIMNSNSNDNMLSISEILKEDEKKELKDDDIIKVDRIFDTNNEDKMREIKRDKKIEKIQIGLIIFLVVVASLVYFFGYDFFEPYIKID